MSGLSFRAGALKIGAFGLLLAAMVMPSFGGCGLVTSGDGPPTGPSAPTKCENAVHCDDGNPCTVDVCSDEGLCVATPVEGDPPSQPSGDCKRVTCAGGLPTEVPDDTDVDDGNACTFDVCQGGAPTHTNADGDPCLLGAETGVCKAGVCAVSCASAADSCDDANPCTEDACDLKLGECTHDPTKLHGTLISDSDQSDCTEQRCKNGVVATVPDDSEIPGDSNDCTADTCVAGAPVHSDIALNTACGLSGGMYCDGAGKCVQCNDATQCGTDDDCNTFTCNAKVCGVNYTAAGTVVTAQVDWDCQVNQCNGTGGVKTVPDDTDLPNDANDCTNDICTGGVPSHTDVALGTACASGACDGAGTCKKDQAALCVTNADCATGFCVDFRCCDTACSAPCKSCAVAGALGTCSNIPQFTEDAFPLGSCVGVNSCDGAGTCKKDNGQSCAALGECTSANCVDARCCDTACVGTCKSCDVAGSVGTCTNTPKLAEDSFPMNACVGVSSCDGAGACKADNGQACAAAIDCASGNCVDGRCCDTACAGTCKSCNVAGVEGTCSNVPQFTEDTFPMNACVGVSSCDGAGSCKKDNGQACAAASECSSANCVDGRCCNTSCTGTCKSCNVAGVEGTCSNIPALTKDNFPAGTCAGTNSCDGAGSCKKDNGQICAAASDCSSANCVDGRCCNTACTGTCMACNVAGSLGTCTNLPVLTDDTFPAGACTGTTTCDGAGNCKEDLGQACAVAADCASANCVDGTCCNTACTGTCKACNIAASLGTCSNIAQFTEDNFPLNACVGVNSCDGAGACKKDNGQSCAAASECSSANCVDGVCCNTSCASACKSCNVAGSVGTCSNIPQATEDNFPVGICIGVNSCDGAGNCRKDNGQSCAAANECSSAICVDGFCCNSACTGLCKACNVVGFEGACSNIVALSEDNFPVGSCTGINSCDGAGNCTKDNGQTCAAAAECSSGNCVDGYCCNSGCGSTCKACNVVGLEGACSNIPALTEDNFPVGACVGVSSCDGAGTCKKDNGQTCAAASECSSGNCVDGYCCNNTCTTACKACNIAGSLGTCSNVAQLAQDNFPVGACVGVNSCNGAGTCTKANGQTCAAAAECSSGNCVDGYCCNSTCTGLCKACNVVGVEGACSNIVALSEDNFPVGSCTGVSSCDGAGNCTKDNGQTCAAAAECSSGNCVDGYCCNSGCGSTCKACNVVGLEGACSNIPALTEDNFPVGACVGVSSCDGAGTCKKDNGQTCAAASECSSGNCVDGYCCNSACTTACMACDVAGSLGACSNMAQFAQDNFPVAACTGVNSCNGAGTCTKANGQTCAAAAECSSGNCVDGYCCNSACTTACMACDVAGSLGTCSNMAQFAQDNFPVAACAGVNSCNGAGVCTKANGQTCAAAAECSSAQCVDTVCCNTACGASCEACSAAKKGAGVDGVCGFVVAGSDPDNNCNDAGAASCGDNGSCDGAGACQKYAAGTVCLASSCAAGTQTNAKTCDGAGTCNSNGTLACTPFICGPTACKVICAMDSDCVAGRYCDMAGACQLLKANGAVCAGSNECTSAACVEGVCCNNACGGTCRSCLAAKNGGADGTCGDVVTGTDPDNECAVQAASTCGTTGVCGSGACAKYAAGTECIAPTCTAGIAHSQATCDGAGTCSAQTNTPCTPFICGPTACTSSCVVDNDCAAGNYCATNVCTPKLGNGGVCLTDNQCTSNFCVDGFCCTGLCDLTCESCANAKTGQPNGACAPILVGQTDDAPICGGVNACNGSGVCLAANGEICVNNGDCASNNCVNVPPKTCMP